MIKKVSQSVLKGELCAITSKSFAHRAMICHYLATGLVDTFGVTESADVLATKRCLLALKNGGILDAGESGSTLRFLIPLVLAKADIERNTRTADNCVLFTEKKRVSLKLY